MSEQIQPQVEELDTDIDRNGHLALALFVGGMTVLLLVIYALTQAA